MKDLHSAGASPHTSPVNAAVLTEQQVIEHLKYCRDLTRVFAYRVFPGFWRHWCRSVGEHAEAAASNHEQLALLEVQRLLLAVQQAAEHEFAQHLGNNYVKFKNKALNTRTGEERFSGDILSLVEHADLEETIAITSITHRADAFYGEVLWALQQRLALLNDGEKIDERSNPASPVQFCEALRRVLGSMDVDVKTKIIGYKTFEEEVIRALDGLYEALNQYLISQQLMPNLRFVAHRAEDGQVEQADSGESPQRRASDRLLNGELSPGDVQYQASLLNAIRLLQVHADHPGPDSPEAAPAVLVRRALSSENSRLSVVASPTAATTQVYEKTQLIQVLQGL